jgi:hypothetical protein
MVRELILEKGYRDEDIPEIARKAAIAKGMSNLQLDIACR